MALGQTCQFEQVFAGEVNSINKRRKWLREQGEVDRRDIELEPEPLETSDGSKPCRPTVNSEVVGLALSGGGVRSAAFCLGTLQALYEAKVLPRVDYLSTVSGGGYIGSSLSAGMTAADGHFPFKSGLSEDETPSLQHIRDHSNYLFPKGATDFLHNAAIYLRGLVTNAVLILPFLLAAAVATIVLKPVANGVAIIPLGHFVITVYLFIFAVALATVWGVIRSRRTYANVAEVPNEWTRFVGALILILIFEALCELQPFILDAMFTEPKTTFLQAFITWVKGIALVLAPFATVVALAARKFGEVIKSSLESERLRDQIGGHVAKLAVYVAGAIVPILLWALYLQFSYWGICETEACRSFRAPGWLSTLAEFFPGSIAKWLFGDTYLYGKLYIAQLYAFVAIACLLIVMFLRPNANSLHPLYRDRLSKAFLFTPAKVVPRDATGSQPPLAPFQPRLSELSEENSPYHLINTALNVQGSKHVNRRGRNADFFIFSRNFIGSKTTDYVTTADIERVMLGLNLGTAMAASGAAASSNMGAATIKPLTPTLALLNIRLGYWLRNPRKVALKGGWNRFANFYFLLEMFGKLNERRRSIYVTDGGHIENLGIYELLRRRCTVIIAVDAEADPQMAFGSFNVLVRHALIDLGVRIDLPWQQIADASKSTAKGIDDTGDCPKLTGPHVAVGEIAYPAGRRGILIYIKASITGDENDYIFHYKKRYSAFPHETTLDQLFSEEQFEAYRALGFHATYRFFDRRDSFAHRTPEENPCTRDDLEFLDKTFPLKSAPNQYWPREHATFADWLPPKNSLS